MPVLGPEDSLIDLPDIHAVCAIGDPRKRRSVVQRLQARGVKFATIVHPSVARSGYVSIGEGSIIASQVSLTTQVRVGRHVIVNFTAAWCITCIANEKVTLQLPSVAAAMKRADMAYLKGDWTRRDPAITRFLTRHGAAGVPLYLWYPAGGEAQQLPQVLTPDSLVELAEDDRPSTG